jgi:hypothetical protein
MLAVGLLSTGGLFISAPAAEASQIRNCSVPWGPEDVDYISSTTIWVASNAGYVSKFNSSDCTHTETNVGGYQSTVAGVSSTKVAHASFADSSVGYLDPSTGTDFDCASNTNVNGPDKIVDWDGTYQYLTSYNAGKLVRVTKGASSCTYSSSSFPLSGASPIGLAKSSNADYTGLVTVDSANKKLYKFNPSTSSFTLCTTFTGTPKHVAVDNGYRLAWVTMDKKVVAVNLTNCSVTYTSPDSSVAYTWQVAPTTWGDAFVTFDMAQKVARYDSSTASWKTPDDWSSVTGCLDPYCETEGIDASVDTYYATVDAASSSKFVVGTIAP